MARGAIPADVNFAETRYMLPQEGAEMQGAAGGFGALVEALREVVFPNKNRAENSFLFCFQNTRSKTLVKWTKLRWSHAVVFGRFV
jgi:hypothetical protein